MSALCAKFYVCSFLLKLILQPLQADHTVTALLISSFSVSSQMMLQSYIFFLTITPTTGRKNTSCRINCASFSLITHLFRLKIQK